MRLLAFAALALLQLADIGTTWWDEHTGRGLEVNPLMHGNFQLMVVWKMVPLAAWALALLVARTPDSFRLLLWPLVFSAGALATIAVSNLYVALS